MPIRTPPAPASIVDIATESLGRLQSLAPSHGREGAEEGYLTEPMPLYRIDSDLLAAGEREGSFVPIGWRLLYQDEAGQTHFADLAEEEGEFRISRIATGPAVENFLAAGALAEQAVSLEAELELRVLESTPLKIGALWLCGEQARFLPYFGLDSRILDEGEMVESLEQRVLQRRRAQAGSSPLARIIRTFFSPERKSGDDDEGEVPIKA